MTLFTNISMLVTVSAEGAHTKTGEAMRDLRVIHDGAVLFNQHVVWVGHMDEVEALVNAGKGVWADVRAGRFDEVDCSGQTVMPGFVDSHTHLVFAGSRSQEFARRLAGTPYTQIAAEGGGILTTMEAVRTADVAEIHQVGEALLYSAIEHGTTTIEIKSGYGLSTESELKLLEAAQALKDEAPIDVHITFLGAHDVPPEYKHDPDAYVDRIVKEMLPAVVDQGFATACDVFTDKGFFTIEQSQRILNAAKDAGLDLHVHADEIANIGASRMAAEFHAFSADHLEYTSVEDMQAMRDAGVVATLLPGTAYTLRLPYPDARRMINEGLVVALATDCNPGSCFTENMQGILSLACVNMGMSIEEAIVAATLHGAHALRVADRKGSIEVGKDADLVIYDVPSYTDIVYHFGTNQVYSVWAGGEEVA